MKRYILRYTIVAIFATVVFSCHKDDSLDVCHKRYGNMKVNFTDDIKIDFDHILLENQTQTNFDITAAYLTDDCLLRTGINFFGIKKELFTQQLVKYDWGDVKQEGSIIFQTYDNADALTERFLLYEEEPHWVQLTEINRNEVKGKMQATFIYNPSNNRHWNLPDTLRFNNVEFKAVVYTGPPFTW